jgi:hypothetical protein
MNCAEIQELLSVVADGASDDAVRGVEARTHCDTCPQCARFRGVICLSGQASAPAAPPDLVNSLVVLARDEAARLRAEGAEGPIPLPLTGQTANRRVAWLPRLTAYVAAAAVVVVSVTALSLSMGRLDGQKATEDTALAPETALRGAAPTTTPENGASAEERAAADATARVAAPSYVTLDGRIFRLVGPATVAPSALTTAGVVASAFDTTGPTGAFTAWYVRSDRTRIFVERTLGSLTSFEAVVRSFGAVPYQLVSGGALDAYGIWPSLPSRFAPPTEADGSPTFRYLGTDDLGSSVYVPAGGRIADGFAVAPGTAPADPAAGNPNWTWWQPLP